jgi:hypothetical protein
MKVFGDSADRIHIPHGEEFPQYPISGEMFRLTKDEADSTVVKKWHPNGVYVYSKPSWIRMNDSGRERKVGAIGAQEVLIENAIDGVEQPSMADGVVLARIAILPSNRKASFSGTMSIWVGSEVDTEVALCVFRDQSIVGLTAQTVKAGESQTMSLTFLDFPFTKFEQTYTVRVFATTVGELMVNKSSRLGFDGVSQTAFIVEENTPNMLV